MRTLSPAPPRPPGLDVPPDPEALIQEARRRARRRRGLYALAGLLAAGGAVAGFDGFHGGGTPASAPGGGASAPSLVFSRPAGTMANGPLALVDATSQDRIELVGQDGLLIRRLPICRAPRCGGIQSAAWSPDGTTLAYGTTTGGGAAEAPRDGLHLLDLRTNRDRLLDHTWTNWQDLAWSPNAKQLAYVADATVHALQVAHPQRDAVVRQNATSPTWSPDGRLMAFDGCAGGRTSGISLGRANGSHVRRVTRTGCSPAWSPDGSRIAYTVWCGIRVIAPTGRDLTAPSAWLCRHIGVSGPPVWSPDGRKIAVGGSDGVYLMNRDGSGLTKIWSEPAERPSWRPVPRR